MGGDAATLPVRGVGSRCGRGSGGDGGGGGCPSRAINGGRGGR